MIKKNHYVDIDTTARLPTLNLHNADTELLNKTEILRFDLERVDGAGEWTPVQHHTETAHHPERLAAAGKELALLQKQFAELQLRHELLMAYQDDLQARLATGIKTAARARAENSKNVKHIAKLLKRINEQQEQLLSMKTSRE